MASEGPAEPKERASALVREGEALAAAGDAGRALTCFLTAIQSDQANVTALAHAADVLRHFRRLDEAIAMYRRAVALEPGRYQFHFYLAVTLCARGFTGAALAEFSRAAEIDPAAAEARANVGNMHAALFQWEPAIASLRAATALAPGNAGAWENLGHALVESGRPDEAVAVLSHALALVPDGAETHATLSKAMLKLRQIPEAAAEARRAIHLPPNDPARHSHLLFAMNLLDPPEPTAVYAESREWARRHAALPEVAHAPRRVSGRPLRVGYVSPDFRRHAVAHFFLRVLQAHDRSAVTPFLYSDAVNPDDVTEQFAAAAGDGWRNMAGLEDDVLVRQVLQDGIDVLVDLAGHTSGNRLRVFARKPAPIQVSYLGYTATTGVGTIDYRLTDAVCDPPGNTERHYVEKLVRLDGTFAAFSDLGFAPTLARPGHEAFTFGALTRLEKISPRCVKLWSDVLRAAGDARLLIHAPGLGPGKVTDDLLREFAAHGVDRGRIELGPHLRADDYFRAHARVDVMLDTTPVNGHTTTCWALWMGVPVLTLAGESFSSRLGASVLEAVGLNEWVCFDPARFMTRASEVAVSREDVRKLGEPCANECGRRRCSTTGEWRRKSSGCFADSFRNMNSAPARFA